jgi:hypothetical protein
MFGWALWMTAMADERSPMVSGLSYESCEKGRFVVRLSVPQIYAVRPMARESTMKIRISLDKNGHPLAMAIEASEK